MRWKRTSIIGWTLFWLYSVVFLLVVADLSGCAGQFHSQGPTETQEEIMRAMDATRKGIREACIKRYKGRAGRQYIACGLDIGRDCTYEYCDALGRRAVLQGQSREIKILYRHRP